MASTEGGVEIETVAEETPELIHKAEIDPLVGPQAYQARELGFKLGLNPTQMKQFVKIFMGLGNMFNDFDFALLEINPLVITDEGNLHCLDGKIGIDGNALYRQPKIREMHDPSQEDAREAHAASFELNYVALDGNVGCMVNGAGLAMATMDLIKQAGGEPANFLDVGGTADAKRVEEAFRLILKDDKVEAILVNIFGGIVRCDRVAQGIVDAYKNMGDAINVPIIVRLQGTNADVAKELIDSSGLNVESAVQFQEAADKVQKVLA
jgi:succinyl-CoA synthetase beta subunit